MFHIEYVTQSMKSTRFAIYFNVGWFRWSFNLWKIQNINRNCIIWIPMWTAKLSRYSKSNSQSEMCWCVFFLNRHLHRRVRVQSMDWWRCGNRRIAQIPNFKLWICKHCRKTKSTITNTDNNCIDLLGWYKIYVRKYEEGKSHWIFVVNF